VTDESPLTFREQLGRAIADERRRRGLSQTQLANLAGLSLKYVGEIERAEANVSAEVLQRLFTAMNWRPVLVSHDFREPLPIGVRDLVRTDLRQIAQLAALAWDRFDVEAGPDTIAPTETTLKPRGRPRVRRRSSIG
jgi:transcriptional regulator with XRE-family HTH domain